MSRPYRILVKKTVREEVRAGDRSTLRLNLDDILPQERMKEVLGQVLERNGWREIAEGIYEKRRENGERMTCDLEEYEVVTTIELEDRLEEEVSQELRGDRWNWRLRRELTDAELEELRRQAEAELERQAITEEQREQARKNLRYEALRRLEESEPERRREINKLVLEVYSEALKEKARQLGNVQGVEEGWKNEEEYELVISLSE